MSIKNLLDMVDDKDRVSFVIDIDAYGAEITMYRVINDYTGELRKELYTGVCDDIDDAIICAIEKLENQKV